MNGSTARNVAQGAILLGALGIMPALADAELMQTRMTDPHAMAVGQAEPIETYVARMPGSGAPTTRLEADATLPRNLGSFDIHLNPSAGLSSNTDALDAFERAAGQWEHFISDPITVNIDAGLDDFSADGDATNDNVIGQTSSQGLKADYNSVRQVLISDASNELTQGGGFDDSITNAIPTQSNYSATIPTGTTLSGEISATRASFKAMGYPGVSPTTGNDATITFNSAFSFDYDNSDGIDAGTKDFQTVAAHEIGHALGFTSEVDQVDNDVTDLDPNTFDFYRFADDVAGEDPDTVAEFATFPRNLTPGDATVFDDILNEYPLSTGVNDGDGNQASHWKDDGISGNLIGIMDPTLPSATEYAITPADLRALDLIGYEIAIPEPGTFALLAAGSLLMLRPARKRAAPRRTPPVN